MRLRLVAGLVIGSALIGFTASSAHAQGFTTDDTQLRFDGASVSPLQATARAGFTGAPAPGGGIVPIFVYRLPTLAPGTVITNAVLSINLASITVAGSINYNVDLYAIPFRATPTVGIADFFVGPSDPSSTTVLIQDNFVQRSNPVSATPLGRYNTNTTGSANLAAFLNAQYVAGALGGPTGNFVFFRLSPDVTTPLGNGGFDFHTQDNASTSGLRPTLTLTTGVAATAPEPSSVLLTLVGLTGFCIRRRKARRVS